MIISPLHRIKRLALAVLLAAGPVAGTSQAATGEVKLSLVGKEFGDGKSLTAKSGNWRILPSKRYTYDLNGTWRGTGELAGAVPPGTSIAAFLESLKRGSSKHLRGTFDSPTGKLPVTLLTKEFTGSRNVAGVGRISTSFTLGIEIKVTGEVEMTVNQVKLSTVAGPLAGSLKFSQGTFLTVKAAPMVHFISLGQSVAEDAGSVTVEVLRTTNRDGVASVRYATEDGTAVAGRHYKSISGVLKFASGETVKKLTVPLIDNAVKDGYRTFSLKLSKPGGGAVLGPRLVHKVGIQNDD